MQIKRKIHILSILLATSTLISPCISWAMDNPPLSKNAKKKLAKQEAWNERKAAQRASAMLNPQFVEVQKQITWCREIFTKYRKPAYDFQHSDLQEPKLFKEMPGLTNMIGIFFNDLLEKKVKFTSEENEKAIELAHAIGAENLSIRLQHLAAILAEDENRANPWSAIPISENIDNEILFTIMKNAFLSPKEINSLCCASKRMNSALFSVPVALDLSEERNAQILEKMAYRYPGTMSIIVPECTTTAAFQAIKSFKYLTLVDISQTKIKNLEHLQDMPLIELHLWKSEVRTADGLKPIEQMTSLKELDLRGLGTIKGGLSNLSGLTNLTSLNLNGSPHNGLGWIKDMVHLKELKLRRTQVNVKECQYLENLTNLRTLDLAYTNFREDDYPSIDLAYLGKLVNLHTLDLSSTRMRGQCLQYLPLSLKTLHLERCVDCGDSYTMRESTLAYNGEVSLLTTVVLPHLSRLTGLTTLNLSYSHFNDKGLKNISSALTNLSSLDLSYTHTTYGGLRCLTGLKGLTSVKDRNGHTHQGLKPLMEALDNSPF